MTVSKDTQAKAALALRDLASGLYTVDGATSLANKPLKVLKYKLKSIETLENNRDQLEQGATKMQKIAKVFEKVGPTKLAGKITEKVADRTKKSLDKIETQLEEITEVTNKIAVVVEKTSAALSKISGATEKLGLLADVYSRKLAVADQNLEAANQLFDTGIPFFGDDDSLRDDLKLQMAIAAEKNSTASAEIALVVAIVCQLEENINGLSDITDFDGFGVLDSAKEVMDKVASVLSPLFSPLSAIYDAVGPVLDALGSIFGWLLKPAEWALDAILEATGINDLLNAAADEILSFLPNLDILEGLAERLEKEILADLENYLSDMIEAPFARIEALLGSASFPLDLSVPTDGDDALYGSINDDGPRNVNAGAGNDIVVGGEYDDTLNGGAGRDLLIGGAGDDVLIGGANLDGGPDMAIYDGSINDYGIVSKLLNGERTGIWFVVDYRDSSFIEGTDIQLNTGTDRLEGIEAIAFSDDVLDLRNIATFIRTQTADGEFARVTPTETTLPDIAGQPQITADRDNDRIVGALGYDILLTGGGDDLLYSGSNGPKTADIQNSVGDNLQGGNDNDTYVSGPTSGGLDFISDTSGNDNINYALSEYGMNVFLGSSRRELLYRPTSITIDADPVGRTVPGNVLPVGVLRGIENIEGTNFNDVFIGSDVINKIKGGKGNDQIRGLDGDDVLLGGDGDDTLIGDGGDDFLDGGAGSNVYVAGLGDDYISDLVSTFSTVKYAVESETAKYNQSVDFVDFLTTGGGARGNAYDMPGGIVILPTAVPFQQQVSKYQTSTLVGDRYGVDYLEGIEIIVGSVGRDIIYTSRDISQIVYGGTGSDDLFSDVGDTQNTFYAGPGDDFFVSDTLAEDTFFGGSGSDTVRIWGDNSVDGDLLFGDDNRQTPLNGIDVLDMSQSDYSWHVYMNPNAPNGQFVGKYAQASLYDADVLFIQPTEGVDGVVRRQSGVNVPGARYPGVNHDLITADPNTPNPGGEARNMGEFEHIIGSDYRDVISGGNPDAGLFLEGRGGDDVLYAAQVYGATLSGGAGNDVLGTYNHTLGNDTPGAFFDAAQRTIMEGGLGDDTFVAGDFREEMSGGDGTDRLTYEVSTGGVTVDLAARTLDGGYATGDILVGGIEDVSGSQQNDVLSGDAGRNVLVGWFGNDTLSGREGADVLYGNDGDDELFGGAGNDLLHGGRGADRLDGGDGLDAASWNLYQEDPKGGAARLSGEVFGITADLQTGLAGTDTLVGIENLVGGVGDDTFYGDSLGNLLSGNLGDDVLEGRGGDDLLTGGAGDDTLRGGADNDFLSAGGGTNDIDGGSGTDTLDYSILTYGIDLVMAGVGARAGEASGQAVSFVPEEAYVWNDSVVTVAGPTGLPGDTVVSGSSETRFTFERFDKGTDDPADDTFVQRAPITPERIWKLDPFFATAPGDVERVDFLPDTLRPEQQVVAVDRYTTATDIFRDIEVIVGSQGDDRILGNTENTEFNGGTGADTITGGDGSDTASYLFSEAAVRVDLQARTALGGDAQGDVLTQIENLKGSIYGDSLTGDGAANRLAGAGGSDTIRGGGGTDTVVFDTAVTDVIVARTQSGVRIIVETDGVIFTDDHVADDVEIFEFTDRTLSRTDLAGLIISGTDQSEEIIGTAIADNLRAGGGNDTVFGLRGNDEIHGDAGADQLFGEAGNDTVFGGTGADTLDGGAGADVLTGGPGRDRFVGGTGDDVFVINDAAEIVVEAANAGSDTVRASVSDTLQANVEALELTGSADLQGTGNTLDNLITGNAGANLLRGLAGNDRLEGGAGIDTLEGGADDDTYVSRDGLDIIVETANGGRDKLESWVSAALGGNIEDLALMGDADLDGTGTTQANEIAGSAGDNAIDARAGDDTLLGSFGDDTLTGGDGTDTVIYSFERAAARFDFDDPDFILVYKPGGIDSLRGIESFRFADQTISTDALRLEVLPKQDVQLYAASYYENDYAIDMSREGGGAQFLNVGPASQGSNRNNEFHFTTAFLDDGGRAFFGGQSINNLARATVNNFTVDFSGGNTTMMSVFGFVKPLLDILDAPWGYWETNIFNGDDRVVGSYFSDTLVGFAGDDTIFGGLGDKEEYAISDTGNIPSPTPSTIRQAGKVASDAAFLVHDGDDLIDGEGGNDLLDGGTGNDTLFGGDGNDKLWGGAASGDKRSQSDAEALRDTGADLLDGGAGNDTLEGGAGNDTMTGGAGDDTFVVTMGMGQSRITDFGRGNDVLDFGKLTTAQRATVTDQLQADGTRLITLSDGSTLRLTLDDGNTDPTGSVAILGTATEGQTLSVDVSELADADGLGPLSFQWLRDGAQITGAKGDTYTVVQADVGRAVTVEVSYTDGAAFGEVVRSAATAPVANVNDPVSGAIRIDGLALEGRILEANTDGLNDPDGIGRLQYQWARDGADVTGAQGATYTLGAADLGAVMSVTARYVDNFSSFEVATGPATARVVSTRTLGTETGDYIGGTTGGDYIDALGGNDTIAGGGGGDALLGGAGDDFAFGDGFQGRYALPQANQVYRLYQATLDRAPDAFGHAYWSGELYTKHLDLASVVRGFVNSREFSNTYGDLGNSDFVTLLYQNVLERAPDAGGLAAWLRELDQGTERSQVVLGFSDSLEFTRSTTDAANLFAVNANPGGWSDDIFRLYRATLDRDPDSVGFAGWSEALSTKAAFETVISGFVNSVEFRATYGSLNETDFVGLLYNNVLGRDADAVGLAGWLDVLADGGTRESVVKGFAQSSEFRIKTAAPLADWMRAQGVDDVIAGGAGTNVLAGGVYADTFQFNKTDGGSHTVLDLEPWDVLSFDGFGYAGTDQALTHFAQVGGNVVFADQGTTVTLIDTQLDQIASDLISI